MGCKEICWESVDWINLAENRDQWHAFVTVVNDPSVLKNASNILTSWWSISFLRRTVLHGVNFMLYNFYSWFSDEVICLFQVRDCVAKDASSVNVLKLTDERGCILRPKLIGAFQKTRDTGASGASIIAYAFFQVKCNSSVVRRRLM
jgi:hypothetical protein